MNRGPVSEIDLSALQHNLKIIRQIAGDRTIIAVVKADAYGHGSVPVAQRLVSNGISCLAVAYTGEAKILREAGVKVKILVLFDSSGIDDFFLFNLTPVVWEKETASRFSKEAVKRGKRIQVHLKVDTGMGRVGMSAERAVADAAEIGNMPGVEVEGLLSHFSEADMLDSSFAFHQMDKFNEIRNEIEENAGRKLMAHMASSAAVLSLKTSLLDAVRPGLALYGYSPLKENYGLRPLMRIKTKILSVRNVSAGSPVSYGRSFIAKKDSKVGVIPVGYADGYNRLFSNNAEMLVRGRRVPVIGRVCMDLTMIDITELKDVTEGEEVVLLGGQGNDEITAVELSSRINTIPYEILTSLGSRSKREYIN